MASLKIFDCVSQSLIYFIFLNFTDNDNHVIKGVDIGEELGAENVSVNQEITVLNEEKNRNDEFFNPQSMKFDFEQPFWSEKFFK